MTSPRALSVPIRIRPLMVRIGVTALGFSLMLGCPGDEGDGENPQTGAEIRAAREAEVAAREAALVEQGRQRGVTAVDPDRGEVKPLAFDGIEISPAEPKIDVKQLRASSTLKPGATPFTDVDYQWFVGGREIVGYRRSVLRKEEGRWKTGDTVEVIAHAIDEKGRTARSAPARVVFGNTPPVITTNLRNVKYLNGTRLEAVDEDGDEVTWSVEGDPPGVSVSAAGVVKVRNVQMAEDWNGEAVFVATDPHGARSEIHIPLSVNARKDGRTEEAGTLEQRTTSRTMTEAELIKAAEADAKRFEGMSQAEIDAELNRRDAIKDE